MAFETAPGVTYEWRGDFSSDEANVLHADAFGHDEFTSREWDWRALCEKHSLGWVVARRQDGLVGFVNVLTDGFVHAWLQDVMVATRAQRLGLGVQMINVATEQSRAAGCEWLHVDFDDALRPFYFDAAGFRPTTAGLIDLTE